MATTSFDTSRKFVRIIETRSNGMVEFEFAIGEPELFVELLLPGSAFAEFCATNQVIRLDDAKSDRDSSTDSDAEASDWDWKLRQATHQRFK